MKDSANTSQEEELENLLKQIKEYNLKEVELHTIAPPSIGMPQHDLQQILKDILNNIIDYTIVDVRSEKEYSKNSIPFSINIPILNNTERHQVGLIYMKHSNKLALSLAYYFAERKEQSYIESIKEAIKGSKGKRIILYCWRGGSRSRYVANLLKKHDIEAITLQGGHKGFRRIVHDLLYNKSIPIISLSGETGCGKSEILEYIQENHPDFPVIHLEKCAGHASSVFGEIRFYLKNKKIQNQQQFETNIFMEILPHIHRNNNLPVFLSENESKKIGNLIIPPAVLIGLENELHISITCSLERRIQRLSEDYFASRSSDDNIKSKAKENVITQLKLLNKKFNNAKMEQYEEWINNNQYFEFLKDIMKYYYDRIYKKPMKEPIISIENRDTAKTVREIFSFWHDSIK